MTEKCPDDRIEDQKHATSMLPIGLLAVLRLPRDLRHCFVLRSLFGLPRRTCGEFIGNSQSPRPTAIGAIDSELPEEALPISGPDSFVNFRMRTSGCARRTQAPGAERTGGHVHGNSIGCYSGNPCASRVTTSPLRRSRVTAKCSPSGDIAYETTRSETQRLSWKFVTGVRSVPSKF
jgi:hypothetical protein